MTSVMAVAMNLNGKVFDSDLLFDLSSSDGKLTE